MPPRLQRPEPGF